MRETEVKAVVPDADELIARLEAAGARRTFTGSLRDERYDTASRDLAEADLVLRLRVYAAAGGETRAELDFKGPTAHEGGYKVREEVATGVTDPAATRAILGALGYAVTREIEREIAQFALEDASVRIERYPRLDVLVEVEGEPDAIERAIAHTGIAREAFTARRLPDFVAAYEARTGERAALCASELQGERRYRAEDA